MRVYVVTESFPYEGSEVLAVAESAEVAKTLFEPGLQQRFNEGTLIWQEALLADHWAARGKFGSTFKIRPMQVES